MLILAVLLTRATLDLSFAPPSDLPQCLRGLFRGITNTTPTGEIIGSPDRDDWGCAGDRGHGAGNAGSGPGPSRFDADGGPVPQPTVLCFREAAPNPAQGATRLGFSLPQSAHVTLIVYGQHHRQGPLRAYPVRTLMNGDFQAGQYEVLWDLRDDGGQPVSPGIYRALLEVGTDTICGDIQVP